MTWCALSLLMALPTLANGASAPDAGAAAELHDVVRELVAKDLAAKFAARPLAGGEVLQPGAVFFANPAEPRFVTVDLALSPASPSLEWTPRVTRFLGFHELKYAVDRSHLRIAAAPSEEALRSTLASVLRSRAQAVSRARAAFGKRCARPVVAEADFIMPSGVEDFWRLDVVCDGKTFEVIVKKDGETVSEARPADPSVPAWLAPCERTLTAALANLARADARFSKATVQTRVAETVNASSRPVTSVNVLLEASPDERYEAFVTEPLEHVPASSEAAARWAPLENKTDSGYDVRWTLSTPPRRPGSESAAGVRAPPRARPRSRASSPR